MACLCEFQNQRHKTDETVGHSGDHEEGAPPATRGGNRGHAYYCGSGAATAAGSVGDTPDFTIANIKVVLCRMYLMREDMYTGMEKNVGSRLCDVATRLLLVHATKCPPL